MSHNQRVSPIKFHETTIFLWLSYGFPVGFGAVIELGQDLYTGPRAPVAFEWLSGKYADWKAGKSEDPLSSNVAGWKYTIYTLCKMVPP